MPPTFRLTGLIAAPFTPFHADGRLNPEAISPMAEMLIEAGVSGVFVCGSTGEGHSLTVAERRTIAETWVKIARKRLKIVLHVGHNSQSEAAGLAANAQTLGVDAISALAPSYYKPKTVNDLVEFFVPIAAAAPSLPFYYYNIPSMTAVSLPTPDILREGKKRIPTLNGLKFTHNDMMEFQECLALQNGEFDVVFGFDEMLLSALAFGAKGAVGSTYNFAAPAYLRVIAAFEKGDLATARQEQFKCVQMIRALIGINFMPAAKSVMSMIGVDCGPVRSPLTPITAREYDTLRERLKPLDIFTRPLR